MRIMAEDRSTTSPQRRGLPTREPRGEIIYCSTHPPGEDKTGGLVYTRRVLEELSEKGVQVEVLCPPRLPRRSLISFAGTNLYFLRCLLARQRKPSLILQEFYVHPWFCLFALVNRLVRKHVLVVFVQSFYHRCQSSWLLDLLAWALAGLSLRCADLIITNSEATAVECTRLAGSRKRVEVVHPGCDLPEVVGVRAELRPTSERQEIRLLSVANYLPRKGIKTLIEMMHYLQQKEEATSAKIVLTVAGDPYDDPQYTRELKATVARYGLEGKVRLVGWQSRAALLKLYQSSDGFVFASIDEGFGMVIAEAMKCGLPVVAMDLPVLRELVEDGVNGFVVPQGRPEEMAEAVARLARDPWLRESMGRAARERAWQIARPWEEVCERFYQILRAA